MGLKNYSKSKSRDMELSAAQATPRSPETHPTLTNPAKGQKRRGASSTIVKLKYGKIPK